MANIKLPKSLNSEDLYLHCELTVQRRKLGFISEVSNEKMK